MALNLSPDQGVKLTKKDRVHVAKKIKQGWKATCLIPDYGFDENGDIQVMSDRNRRAVKYIKARLNDEVTGAIVFPAKTTHEENYLEFIAKDKLRDKLNLEDGDTVSVEF